MLFHSLRIQLLATVGAACIAAIPAMAQASSEIHRQQLLSVFDEAWQYRLRTQPEFATGIGDKRYNDRLGDQSAAFFKADLEKKKKFLARCQAIDAAGLSHQDALSRQLFIRDLREQIEEARFKPWEMPVNQMTGPHLDLPELMILTPFDNVKDYENYIARLNQVPRLFDQVMANMRQGMRDRLMPPRSLLEQVATQAREIASETGESNPLAKPIQQFPASIPAAAQQRLRAALLAAVAGRVLPAYQRFADFVRDEYAPAGRKDPGVWALPDGAERYRFAVRRMTTTDMSPDQIHEIGLKQIDRIEQEMLAVAHKLGFKDIAALNQHIKDDRSLYATSGQQLLDLYINYIQGMESDLPKLFGRLPKSKLIAIPMETSRAKNAVPADYTEGTDDGSRPGHINVNQWDPQHRLLLNVEAIAYHEGIPGHHLQLSLAQEMRGLPSFRQHAEYTAFVEGWALYSERLAKEIGHYQDAYSDYGRLENEMWRAIRLVIDTGVHEKHWSREQMVDYFHRYTAMDEPNVQSEVDRYIAWPGQALAYEIGALDILRKREQAKTKLAGKFDIHTFHDELLGNGALPLDVLNQEVDAWISAQMTH